MKLILKGQKILPGFLFAYPAALQMKTVINSGHNHTKGVIFIIQTCGTLLQINVWKYLLLLKYLGSSSLFLQANCEHLAHLYDWAKEWCQSVRPLVFELLIHLPWQPCLKRNREIREMSGFWECDKWQFSISSYLYLAKIRETWKWAPVKHIGNHRQCWAEPLNQEYVQIIHHTQIKSLPAAGMTRTGSSFTKIRAVT